MNKFFFLMILILILFVGCTEIKTPPPAIEKIGDKIIFEEQMHYTIVKNTTFNGIPLPSIGILRKNGDIEIVKKFGYKDYKRRV